MLIHEWADQGNPTCNHLGRHKGFVARSDCIPDLCIILVPEQCTDNPAISNVAIVLEAVIPQFDCVRFSGIA